VLSAAQLRRHLNAERFVRNSVAPVWTAAAAFAAWRLLGGPHVPFAGAILAMGAVVATLVLHRRTRWSESDARILLDRLAGAGGLSLALAEVPGPEWEPVLESRLALAKLPPRDLGKPLGILAGAAVFCVVAMLLPKPIARVASPHAAASSHVAQAAEKAKPLEEENALEVALAAELERLKQEAEEGHFDASDWASLDAVNEALSQSAAQRAADLAAAEAAARDLADALSERADEETKTEAQEALENALTRLAGYKSGGQELSGNEAQQAMAELKAKMASQSPEQAAAAARAMAKALEARRQAVEKGQAQPAQYASGSRGRQGQRQGSGQGQGQGKEGQGEGKEGEGDKPGSGGISRGPGAAPLTFGEEVPVHAERLSIAQLESPAPGDMGQLIGMTLGAPVPGEGAPTPSLGTAAAGPDGVGPESAPIAPRHRDLVKRYFGQDRGGRRP